MLELTMSEQEFMRDYLGAGLSSYYSDLDSIISRWRTFSLGLDDFPPNDYYQYTLGVHHRQILQDIIEKAPESLGIKLTNEIKPIDEHFRQRTWETRKRTSLGSNEYWFDFRFPNSPSQPLVHDFTGDIGDELTHRGFLTRLD
jgi:hypothetical protein